MKSEANGRGAYLVLTDFSDTARLAYEPAERIAQKSGGTVELLHVIVGEATFPAGSDLPERVTPSYLDFNAQMEEARQRVEREREHFAEGVSVRTCVRLAPSVDRGVLAYADELDADLIALASHGRSGLSRLILGSVAEALVRSSTKPLLVVPASSDGATHAARAAREKESVE